MITAPMSQFPAHNRHSVMLTELSKSGIARAALAMLSVLDAIQVTIRKIEIVHLVKGNLKKG